MVITENIYRQVPRIYHHIIMMRIIGYWYKKKYLPTSLHGYLQLHQIIVKIVRAEDHNRLSYLRQTHMWFVFIGKIC